MSKQLIQQFNDILDSFLIQIAPLVGTTYRYHFQQIVKVNSILPIEQFLVHALPLRDKIIERDETYFTNNNNHADKIGDDQNTLNEILRLQNIYTQLDATSKSNVWDIFQAMLILSEDYLKINASKYT